MNPYIYAVIGEIVFAAVAFAIANAITGGLPAASLQARMSGGSKFLIEAWTDRGPYYTTGWVEDGFVRFKVKGAKKGQDKIARMKAPKEAFHRRFGIDTLSLSHSTNEFVVPETTEEPATVYVHDFGISESRDKGPIDDLLKREAMHAKGGMIETMLILLLLGVLIAIAVSGASAYLSYQAMQALHAATSV